ncbi:MAG: methyltransferase domain-containing protein [Nitrospira sp.]|nr:methyltransferase domain-containing protein [Nitrospira sp.]MDH4369247.1 methyltransferase domain-containing protein [Nitrospira sp.]MDH5496697.1 methyltransferase domain-containing protein [Nitrospira sp.]MDH5724241.1 methyltransferase domain-containing protein [Nitrospira sp.]
MTPRKPQHHITSRDVAQTLQTYERDADVFLKHWGRKQYKRPPLLAEWVKVLPTRAALLDLGCGAGQDARYLTRVGHRVIGLDRAMSLLLFAHGRIPSVPLVLADIRALPIRADSLDGVWAAASLIHVPKRNVTGVLAELLHLVKPAGLFAATFTYGNNSRIKRTGWMPGRYFARWRKDELARALQRAGWTVLSLRVVSNQERKGRWINVIAKRGEAWEVDS